MYIDGICFCLYHLDTPIDGQNIHFTLLQKGLPNQSLQDLYLGCHWSCLNLGFSILLRKCVLSLIWNHPIRMRLELTYHNIASTAGTDTSGSHLCLFHRRTLAVRLDSSRTSTSYHEHSSRPSCVMLPATSHLTIEHGHSAEGSGITNLLDWSTVSCPTNYKSPILIYYQHSCCIAAIVRLVLLNRAIRDIIHTLNLICKSRSCTAQPSSESIANIQHTDLQDKIYIFKIIEPNISIIAACLPCYGPFLGGRAAESLIRSVRSIVSLGSGGSNNTPPALRLRRREEERNVNESEIELRDLGWRGKGQQDAQCVGGKDSQDVEGRSLEQDDGIQITRGVTIVEG